MNWDSLLGYGTVTTNVSIAKSVGDDDSEAGVHEFGIKDPVRGVNKGERGFRFKVLKDETIFSRGDGSSVLVFPLPDLVSKHPALEVWFSLVEVVLVSLGTRPSEMGIFC